MTELETLERAKMYIEKLANGINPIDDSAIPEEDVINNVRLSRCFFYVADVLRQVIDNGGLAPITRTKKRMFELAIEKRNAFAFSDAPITITELVKRINDLNEDEKMSKLTVAMVTDWLISLELLQTELNAEGKRVKRPTQQGKSVGITVENRTNMYGAYSAVVYNLDAQHFVLDNLDGIIELERAQKENQGRPWSSEHDKCLQELYQKDVPIKEIAVTLKRKSSAIRARLKYLGISK